MATSLLQKLQLKAGQRLVVLSAPEGYAERLAVELTGVELRQQSADAAEAVLLFASSLAEAERLMPEGIRAAKEDGLLWVAYPKGSSGIKTDINRDTLWRASEFTGWRPVRQVAMDEVWSAIRFRPAERVGG
jgi:hypothetical protein